MSDLQTLAGETAAKLSTLVDVSESAQTKLIEIKSELAEMRQTFDEVWQTLRDRAASVAEQMNTGKTELATEIESVTQIIAQLQQTFEASQNELTQELEAARGVIAATNSQLSELDIDSDISEAEEALITLGEKEIGTEIEETVGQTIEELDGLGGELSEFETRLGSQVEELATETDQAVPDIESTAQTLSEYYDGLIEQFDTAIQEVWEVTETSIQGLMETASTSQDDLFVQLEEGESQLDEGMSQLENAVEVAKTSVVEATEALIEGIELTNDGHQTAIKLLAEANDALETV